MPRPPAGFRSRLALIATAALALRILYTVLLARHVKGAGDFFFYHDSANLLAGGRGYIDPYLSTAGHPYPTALHPPLWPFALTIASKLGGDSLLAHRLVG